VENSIVGLWAGFEIPNQQELYFTGVPIEYFLGILNQFQRLTHLPADCVARNLYLDVEVWPLALSKARMMGLSSAWINRLAAKSKTRHTVLQVRRFVIE
jgi:hypothetical protein